jgi:hypothetical protein
MDFSKDAGRQSYTMNKNEVIVDLGAEGGSVTLYGFRTERGWLFSMESSQCLDDEWDSTQRSWIVDTWAAALNLLDTYPWVSLFPLSVHPDFRQKIWNALQERFRGSTEEPHERDLNRRWRQICSI